MGNNKIIGAKIKSIRESKVSVNPNNFPPRKYPNAQV